MSADRAPSLQTRMILPVMVVGVMVGIVGSTDRFPAADGPHMLSQAARLSNALLAGEWGWVWEQWFHFTAPHPPVGYVPAILAGLFFDSTRWIVAFADAICLLLLLDAVQRICRKDAWWTGQLAWATGCACSLTWWSSDHYGYDLAAAATVLQAVSWLHRAHTGPRPRDWLFFGFWLAMAFLTKYGAPLICFLPVVWVCGRSVWFRAHHVGLAVLGFVLVAVPYYIENLDTVVPYVRSALNPPDLPGNYPDQRTLLQRFGGEGQGMFLAVLKESYGWPLFLALGWGAVSNRRWVPLLGLASGVILLGAMNSREARYALPLLFLLAAAGAPAARATRGFRLSFALAAALTFLGSARVYAGSSASETPSIRVLQFDSTSLYRWGAWPGIPEAFRPISYDLESWRVTEVVNAMARITDVGDVVTFVSAPGNFGAPESSVYLLASEEIGLGLHFQTVHLAQGARGLMVQSYLAPFVVQGAPASRVVYAVTNGNDLVETWLGSSEARLVASFPLPDGTEGRLGQVQVGVVGGGSRTPMP